MGEGTDRRYGLFVFGAVPMPDAGSTAPMPTERRTDNETAWATIENLIDLGVRADELGYDAYFLAEHHFQHEGYEVVANALMLGMAIAARTERIGLGALVNVLPNWHPLRFAEDFATLHNFSGGRAILGIGRGTVPRETMPLGGVVGSTDDPEARAAQDDLNRARFAEEIEVIRTALDNERFSFHGEHYVLPPPGIPDRGTTTKELTLIPRPRHPYEIWQAVSSPATLEAVARNGFGGVWWNWHPDLLKPQWDHFSEIDPDAGKMLAIHTRIEDTHEEAVRRARPGHDEYWKFLGPYGRGASFLLPDGTRTPPGYIPTLEELMEQRICAVGTAEEVTELIRGRLEQIDCDFLTIFPICLGDPYDEYHDQIERFARDVRPHLDV
jgi:alkanesulfonate monooxygenase SsuD/methylene tetrahydromethanopterin reductase-like flavin-dependent oxidoreductase (luciferase family)